LWANAKASVCFADHKQGNAEVRQLTQSIVERGINQRTAFRFVGFKLCSEDRQAQIEVHIELRGRANAGAIGDSRDEKLKLLSHFVPANRLRNPMKLTYRFESGEPKNWNNMVLHEFGHALGLHHEQLRLDNANGKFCDDISGGAVQPEGSLMVGRFDKDSIMNYCNPKYDSQEVGLSRGDIETIQRMYGNRSDTLAEKEELRCNKDLLVSCIQGSGGASCLDKNCGSGQYSCKNPTKLRECLKFDGGLSCLGASNGQCQG
jgi:hypothetical protein